jgi:hypothetical protein
VLEAERKDFFWQSSLELSIAFAYIITTLVQRHYAALHIALSAHWDVQLTLALAAVQHSPQPRNQTPSNSQGRE